MSVYPSWLLGSSMLWRSASKQYDGLRCDALAIAYRSEMLMGRCLDIDARGVEQLLETRYHLRYMRRKLRLLSDDGEVGIDHLIASLAHHLHDGGEELCAVGTTVPLIGVGEVIADVSLPDRSEERIHQSV